MAMFEEASIGELTVDTIIGGAINPFRRIVYLDPTAGSDGNGRGRSVGKAVKTLANARLQIETLKSDAIVLVNGASPLSLAANPLITESLTSFLGNAAPNMLGKRSMIQPATDYGTPMLTISGYGNLFQDLYYRHGDAFGTATSVVGVLVSGNYNTFRRVHFNGPVNALLGQAATFREVSITATGNVHFDHCVVGTDTIDLTTNNSLVSLAAGSITTWEDCIFLCRISATTPHFFEVLNTSGITRANFKRCQFICLATNMATTMAQAFTFTGGATCAMVFDSECQFVNVTELALSASLGYIWTPRQFPSSADELNLISLNTATY